MDDTGLFEVMEVDDEPGELMIFAEDQQDYQDQSDLCLDIDLRRKPKKSMNDNNSNNNNANPRRKKPKSRIEVIVRKRPMNTKEIENGETDIGRVYAQDNRITICEPRLKVDLTKFTQYHDFVFDHCFDQNSSTKQIYETCVKPLFNTILQTSGKNRFAGKATCFGYGQTGSGKTYTLLGSMDEKTGRYNQGLYAMAVEDLFKLLPANNQIIVSFYEIYGGKLFDLLADRKQILCREDGKQKVNIIGLTRVKCEHAEFLMNVISAGNAIRQTGSTGANNTSSRSHAILSMDILPIRGRLSFIDLAGSERGADTQNNDKQTRIEGAEINKSLLALKECIRALDMNSIHKPFRGSKLTQVLKESFIGNSRTLMIANISPNSGSCENTLNTLRYAYRVKELKNQNNNNNGSDNNNGGRRSMSRNRSEPSLPIYKSVSRPATARKRNSNNNNNKGRNGRHLSVNHGNNGNQQSSKSSNNSEYNGKSNRPKRRRVQSQLVVTEQKQRAASSNLNSRKKIKPSPPKSIKPREHRKNLSPKQQNVNYIENDNDVDMADNDGKNKKEEVKEKKEDVINGNFTKKQLIKAHRKHIDEFMILIKEDMQLLKAFDKDEFDQNVYQSKLRDVLERQAAAVLKYRSKVFNP